MRSAECRFQPWIRATGCLVPAPTSQTQNPWHAWPETADPVCSSHVPSIPFTVSLCLVPRPFPQLLWALPVPVILFRGLPQATGATPPNEREPELRGCLWPSRLAFSQWPIGGGGGEPTLYHQLEKALRCDLYSTGPTGAGWGYTLFGLLPFPLLSPPLSTPTLSPYTLLLGAYLQQVPCHESSPQVLLLGNPT